MRSLWLGVALGLLVLAPQPGAVMAQVALDTPGVYGDQLLFFYDARTGRVPFLAVTNLADASVTLEVVFYSQDLTRAVAIETRTLPSSGNVVIDPTTIAGVSGNAGLATVTPVNGTPPRPVVPPSTSRVHPSPPLFGAFTLANLQLGAGFGENPLARMAVTSRGERAPDGAPVDGSSVRYQSFTPDALVLPLYFAPASLSPPERDGNRIVLAAFEDRYGQSFRLGPGRVSVEAYLDDAAGNMAAPVREVTVEGVYLDTLQGLAAPTVLTGSGKVTFVEQGGFPPRTSLFGLVSQAIGTFAVGQRMPGIFFRNADAAKRVFVFDGAALSGNLGGLAGADGLCAAEAARHGLGGGRFLAWLSDSHGSPATRFTRTGVPYVRVDGTRVADDFLDLTDGTLDAPINLAADGTLVSGRRAFTSTNRDGTAVSSDAYAFCDDWTNPQSTATVPTGDPASKVLTWTEGVVGSFALCDGSQPYGMTIYCFEQ